MWTRDPTERISLARVHALHSSSVVTTREIAARVCAKQARVWPTADELVGRAAGRAVPLDFIAVFGGTTRKKMSDTRLA
jgi:hypothetical protein